MDASGAVRWIVGFALLTAVGCGESSSPPTSPDPSTEQVERLPRLPRPTVQTELFVGAANDTVDVDREGVGEKPVIIQSPSCLLLSDL